MITGMTDVNRDRANALFKQGLDIKKRAHKVVDTFACCQTLFNPEEEQAVKMIKATKLLKYCQQITPKFTTLLKGAAGLVQTATDPPAGPPTKKAKLNPPSESAAIKSAAINTSAAASSTGGQTGNLTPSPAPPPTNESPPKTDKKPKGGGKKKGGGKGAAKKTTLKND